MLLGYITDGIRIDRKNMYLVILFTLFGSGEIRTAIFDSFETRAECERYLLDITRR